MTGLLIAEVNINTLCELGASRGVSLRHALLLLPQPQPQLMLLTAPRLSCVCACAAPMGCKSLPKLVGLRVNLLACLLA